MVQEKVEIRLHDHSLLRVSRTGAGTVYVEHLAPMSLKDGHGWAVKGSVFLLERDRRALLRLLTADANCCKRVQTATETREKTECEKVRKKPNESAAPL